MISMSVSMHTPTKTANDEISKDATTREIALNQGGHTKKG